MPRTVNPPLTDAAILALERPHRDLLKYYFLSMLVFPPVVLVAGLPMYFRYHTMRYKFTDEGISMSWGILFRRETIINYARIQDIHLRSNLIERWLGLARVLVQTASGNASAEMTIEGIKEFESVRDFLYARMRGVKEPSRKAVPASAAETPAQNAELAAALREVAQELRATRIALEANRGH
ncbi:MAG: hypothetical protein C0518_14035 [Opitutus sp.]|nr:hypothetical protein [Opitutus sp.]